MQSTVRDRLEQERSNLEEKSLTRNAEEGIELLVARRVGMNPEQTSALQAMRELALRAGRVQSAKLITHFGDALLISQLREIKQMHRRLGINWEEVCKVIGISRRTADQYLRLASDLGDEFFGDCRRLGLSVRAMEAARQLPEPVREKLTSGEVVDLERVSKEELTRVIRELAEEHAKEKARLEEEKTAEAKAREKAEAKLEETGEKLAEVEREARTLAEGLPPDDAEALEVLRKGERDAVMWLVRIKNTVNIAGRDPMFRARLLSSLNLVAELAQATADILSAQAEGEDVDEDYLLSSVHALNRDAAKYDGREPYAGV